MKNYEKEFGDAHRPHIFDLMGKWRVTVLTGGIPDMSHVGHIKAIEQKGGRLEGHNRLLWLIPWGYFDIHVSQKSAWFYYRNMDAADELRQADRNTLIGRYELDMGLLEGRVYGYFRMERM